MVSGVLKHVFIKILMIYGRIWTKLRGFGLILHEHQLSIGGCPKKLCNFRDRGIGGEKKSKIQNPKTQIQKPKAIK